MKFNRHKILLLIIILISNNINANTISGQELKQKIEGWLQEKGKPANINILEELQYPKCEDSNIIINDISGNSKLIKVNCIGDNPWQFIIRNKINERKKVVSKPKSDYEVFALKSSREKGSILSENDLIKVKQRKSSGNIFITDKSEVIGKKLKKNLRKNQAIRYSNLTNDWLIEKNSIVTIVNNKSFITIKEEGIAMNDANFMEKIRVKNIKSGKVIVGYAKNKKKVILNTKQN